MAWLVGPWNYIKDIFNLLAELFGKFPFCALRRHGLSPLLAILAHLAILASWLLKRSKPFRFGMEVHGPGGDTPEKFAGM